LAFLLSSTSANSVNRDFEWTDKVCYNAVGCFYWKGVTGRFPSPPEDLNTHFNLFTPGYLGYYPIDYTDVKSNLPPHFNPDLPLKFIIHGFSENGEEEWSAKLKDALLDAEDCNVFIVDWENGAGLPEWVPKAVEMPLYLHAVGNTRLIGREIGILVMNLGDLFNKPNMAQNTHVIGHSLGGQIAGYAGQHLRMMNQPLARITGLDPAGPLYEALDAELRLDPSDADFVDVIHSNADRFLVGGLGSYERQGHVDFYPNGGQWQPGCKWVVPGGLHYLVSGNESDVACNHFRAVDFYTASIKECDFTGFACDNYDAFVKGRCFPCAGAGNEDGVECRSPGWDLKTNQASSQPLYFLTRSGPPFCGTHLKVSLKSDTKISLDGTIKLLLKELNYGWNKEAELVELTSDNLTDDGLALEKVIIVDKSFTPHTASIDYKPNDGWFHWLTNWWDNENLKINELVVMDKNGKALDVKFHFVLAR